MFPNLASLLLYLYKRDPSTRPGHHCTCGPLAGVVSVHISNRSSAGTFECRFNKPLAILHLRRRLHVWAAIDPIQERRAEVGMNPGPTASGMLHTNVANSGPPVSRVALLRTCIPYRTCCPKRKNIIARQGRRKTAAQPSSLINCICLQTARWTVSWRST